MFGGEAAVLNSCSGTDEEVAAVQVLEGRLLEEPVDARGCEGHGGVQGEAEARPRGA